MLFVHGFGCDQHMWRYVAPAFEASHRVVLMDLMGAGGSDLPDAPELVPDTEANQRDLHVLRSSLESLKGRVKKVCKAKPGDTTAATVVVDGQGTVLGARGTGRFDTCMGKALTGRTLERTESRTVRLTYDFLW